MRQLEGAAGAVSQATPAALPPEPRRNEGALTLAHFDQARHHLELARTLDEVKEIRDQAEALRLYARQSRQSLEMQNRCAEIKLRAERRAGEMLRETERAQGARTDTSRQPDAKLPFRSALREVDIPEPTARRWQTVAAIPEERFEAHLRETTERGEELTTAGLIQAQRRRDIAERHTANRAAMSAFPSGRFSVLYADPPWSYNNSGLEQSAASQYSTEGVASLTAFRDSFGRSVRDVSHESSALFLWATSPLLPEALDVLGGWGFTYKTSLVWRKNRAPGIGWWTRTYHELLLLGVRSETPQPATKPVSVIDADVAAHSAKPAVFAEIVEAMYPGPKDGSFYLEMFARQPRDGWSVFGNEVARAV